MEAFEKLHYNDTPFLYTDCLTGFYYKKYTFITKRCQ